MIETARLVLRRPRAEDAEALVRELADPAIARQLAQMPSPYTPADAVEWLGRADAAPLLFAITHGDCLIGAVGIGPDEEADGELGYWLGRAHWGDGLATEAARALVDHAAANGVRSLIGGHYLDNPASGRVLAKAGFEDTGRTVPRYSRARGAESPSRLYRWTAD